MKRIRDKELQKLYGSTQWRALSLQIRTRANHMCEHCTFEGRSSPATSTHHNFSFRKPNGAIDMIAFFNGPPGAGGPLAPGLFEALCDECHRIADEHKNPNIVTKFTGRDARGEDLSLWWRDET